MRLIVSIVFLLIFLPGFGQLRELDVAPATAPAQAVQANSSYPDNAMVMVYSSISTLQFRSSMAGINSIRYDNRLNAYLLLVTPVRQVLLVGGPGFIELTMQTISPEPKAVLAFRVEEKQNDPLQEPATLILESYPSGASVWLNEIQTVYQTPARLPLPAGVTRVAMRKDKYMVFDSLVRARGGEEITLQRSLRPEWAELNVSVDPASAVVRLTSASGVVYSGTGSQAWTGEENGLKAGKFRISVEDEGYYGESRDLTLLPGQRSALLFDLIPITGRLSVQSVPSGAEVIINGQRRGITPMSVDMGVGEAEVVVRLERYREAVRKVGVVEQQTRVVDVKLERALRARLEVTSYPSGAEVLVRNEVIGTTPYYGDVDLADRSMRGKQRLEVRLNGYDEAAATIDLQPTENPVRQDFRLVRKQGKYRITTTPDGGVISIDGSVVGTSPVSGSLPTGLYKVTAEKPNFQSGTIDLEIRDRRTTDLGVRMKKITRLPYDSWYFYGGTHGFDLTDSPGPTVNPNDPSDDLSGAGTGLDGALVIMMGRNLGVRTSLHWATNFDENNPDVTYYDRYQLGIGPLISFPLSETIKMEFYRTWGFSGLDIMPAAGSVYQGLQAPYRIFTQSPQILSIGKSKSAGIAFRFGKYLPFYLGCEWNEAINNFSQLNVQRNFRSFSITLGFCLAIPKTQ